MRFSTFYLKSKSVSSESSFLRNLCGMVEYKMLKSKAEIDLTFFSTLILFSLVNKRRILPNLELLTA